MLARMREAGLHHRRGAERRPPPAPAHPAAPGGRRTRAPDTRRSTCGSSSERASAAISRRTGRCTRRCCPAVQDAAEKAVADGLRRLGSADLQAALVALDPRTGNVLAIVGGRDFRQTPFNRAWRSRRQPGSAFKPFVYAAALTRGRSPVSVIRRPRDDCAAGHRGMDAAQREGRGRRSADAAPGAHRIEQPRGRRAAAAHRLAPHPAARRATPGSAVSRTCRRSRSAPAWSRRSISPRRTPSSRTAATASCRARSSACSISRAMSRSTSRSSASACCRRHGRVPDGLAHARRRRSRHRHGGAAVGRAVPGGREDRHDERVEGRLVRRLLERGRRRRVGRLRPAGDDGRERVREPHGAADLGRLHAAHVTRAAARQTSPCRPGSGRRSSAACRTCGRSRTVPPTSSTSRKATTSRIGCARSTAGTLKQRAQRAIEGFFSGLGRRLRDLVR